MRHPSTYGALLEGRIALILQSSQSSVASLMTIVALASTIFGFGGDPPASTFGSNGTTFGGRCLLLLRGLRGWTRFFFVTWRWLLLLILLLLLLILLLLLLLLILLLLLLLWLWLLLSSRLGWRLGSGSRRRRRRRGGRRRFRRRINERIVVVSGSGFATADFRTGISGHRRFHTRSFQGRLGIQFISGHDPLIDAGSIVEFGRNETRLSAQQINHGSGACPRSTIDCCKQKSKTKG